MNQLVDILARLERDDELWRVAVDLPCWPGESVKLWMFADETGPTAYQRRVLAAILQWPTDLKPQVERAAFEHLRQFAGEAFASFSETGDLVPREFPELTAPSQIWALIDSPAIEIPDIGSDEVVEFTINFCSFDIEHPFSLQFEDFQIVES